MKKLHPGAKWLFRIGAYAVLIFLGFFFGVWGGVVLAAIFGGVFFFFSFVLYIVLIFVVGEVYAQMAYNRWFYEFAPEGLKIEKGVIWKTYKSIPYERIQNVDLTRGILARIIGFSTIDIQTAGYSGGYGRRGMAVSEGHIPAVSVAEAEKIRDYVLKKISGKKSRGM